MTIVIYSLFYSANISLFLKERVGVAHWLQKTEVFCQAPIKRVPRGKGETPTCCKALHTHCHACINCKGVMKIQLPQLNIVHLPNLVIDSLQG